MKSDWQVKKLSDLVEFNPTERLPKGAIAKKIPMDILQPFTKDIFQYELQPYNGGAKFRNGDTIMARITPCLENGKVSKVNILTQGEVGFGSTEYIVLRAIPNVSDPDFIYYLTISDFVRAPAIKSMVGSSGRQRVQQNVLETLKLPLPPYDEQKKIAAVLSALDEKIAINRAINENLQQQAASLYFSMFVSYDYYANMEFEDSEFGRIPKGWQVLSLDDVTINIRDRVHNNNYRVLSALNSGILQPSDEYFTKQVFSKDISNYIIVAENDFAYNPARVNIGSLGINDLGYTGCVSPVYVVFRTENNYQNFMRFFVKSKRFQEEVKTRASGSVRQAMNYADFSLIRLVYPPKSAIDEFNDMVEPIWKNIKHLRQENEKLSELRDSLLPKLMSGEIDVSAVQL